MKRHRVAITPNANGYGSHELHVDGHDISKGVHSLKLELNPGEHARVELEMALVDVERLEFETPDLYIPDTTKEALVALGWAPPVEA